MQPLVDEYDVDKLPASVRALLDYDTPLPPRTIFLPRRRTRTSVVLTLAASSLAIVTGLAVMGAGLLASHVLAEDLQHNASVFTGFIAVGLAFALGGMLWAWSVRTKVRGLRAQAAGRPLRYGLFLTDDGLLDRRDVGYTMVPRERIRDVRLDGSGDARVVFAGADGSERGLSLSRDVGELDPPTLVELIRRRLSPTVAAPGGPEESTASHPG